MKNNFIEISFNNKMIKRNRVKLDHTLDIDIIINNKVEKNIVDLRKGKILLVTYISKENSGNKNQISLEQIQEPIIF